MRWCIWGRIELIYYRSNNATAQLLWQFVCLWIQPDTYPSVLQVEVQMILSLNPFLMTYFWLYFMTSVLVITSKMWPAMHDLLWSNIPQVRNVRGLYIIAHPIKPSILCDCGQVPQVSNFSMELNSVGHSGFILLHY